MTPAETVTPPQSVNALLQQMVRFNTVNGKISGRADAEAELAAWLASIAQEWQLSTKQLPVDGHADQLLIMCETDAANPWLLFDSHLDTVAVDGMTIDPFGGEIRDERLFGRGACDTKGTGAAMLWALRQFTLSERRPNNIALLFSVSEEVGMYGIQSFVANDYPALPFKPYGAIVGEPTWLRPVVAHNGVLRWMLLTHGVAAHSAAPHLGKSAISMMSRAVLAIEENYIAKLDARHPLTGQAVCSINVIRGGNQVNIIPEQCSVEIDRRLVPGEDPDSVLPKVQKVLDTLQDTHPEVNLEQQPPRHVPALDPAEESPFLQMAQNVLRDRGLADQPTGAPFATHAGYLSAAGLPSIVLGPGDPRPAHTKDESVALDQIHRGVEFYLALMQAERQ